VLGLLEWDVELWDGITLSNTLDEYELISHRNALARWGKRRFPPFTCPPSH
jgi:hypothetical protein